MTEIDIDMVELTKDEQEMIGAQASALERARGEICNRIAVSPRLVEKQIGYATAEQP